MDALRFPAGARKTEAQRLDLVAWLHENGRVAKQTVPGVFDINDCTATTPTPGHETDDDLSLVRDTKANRVHYSVMPNMRTEGADHFVYERRFVQLDHPPTPFPESLSEWLVDV